MIEGSMMGLAAIGLACFICLVPRTVNAIMTAASCMTFQRALIQDKRLAYWVWSAIPAAWTILRRGVPSLSVRLKDGVGYGEWQHYGKWRIYRGNEVEVQQGEWFDD